MASIPEIKFVEPEDEYYHIRFNDPEKFGAIRSPDWAANVAESVSEGAEVRMRKQKGGDDWEVESVLIEEDENEQDARGHAEDIVNKIYE